MLHRRPGRALLYFLFLLLPRPVPAQHTIDTATPIQPGETGSGVFDSEHANYVWEVELEYDGSLTAVVTQGDKSGAPYVIYDEAITGDTWLDTDGGNLGAGIYYIVVKPFMFPTWEMEPYSIECRFVPNLLPNDAEPNNDRSTATQTGAGVKSEGHLGYYRVGGNDIVDWWTLYLPGDSEFQVLSKSVEGLRLLSPAVYTPDGPMINPLEYHTNDDGSFVQTYALVEGTYAINVTNSWGYGGYTLDTSYTLPALDNDDEPNDELDEADILDPRRGGTGHLGYCTGSYSSIDGPRNLYDTSDFWQVEADGGAIEVIATAEAGLELRLHLYRSDGAWQRMVAAEAGEVRLNHAAAAGTYYVQVEAASGFGSYTITRPQAVPTAVQGSGSDAEPGRFALYPAAPNPCNPQAVIRYEIPRPGYVSLAVYDINGREVTVLYRGPAEPGIHTATWRGTDSRGLPAASGVYLYRLTAGGLVGHGKMVLIR